MANLCVSQEWSAEKYKSNSITFVVLPLATRLPNYKFLVISATSLFHVVNIKPQNLSYTEWRNTINSGTLM